MDNPLATLPVHARRVAGTVGGLRNVPDRAIKWVETGAALAALKTGGRLATVFVRRNPALAVGAVAGAGLLWLAANRRRKRQQEDVEAAETKPRRVRAKRASRTSKQAS